ncbi:Phosphoribosylglycinamide formyltransferase [hydrothermal vent metagenome]|uniref:phosphoribosylglycinamide formyltransferase 1 n=1 Tax=hydrothermal vent metagenome TaxID=652676 RepID=A0A3B1BPH3_9ZZZZ
MISADCPCPLPIVVLISGNGSNLQAIIDAIRAGLPAEIRAVISNRPQAYGLNRAREAGIPAEVIDHHDYPSREAFDQALMARIDHYRPELVVLAGFMRILTDEFVKHYLGRMINIHPSLLPRYQGLNTHQRVLDAGDEIHGVSVHFVTPELDAGPVIRQAEIPVHINDDADTLAQRIHEQEHIIYPQVIRWFAEGRLRLQGNSVLLDDEKSGLG